MTSNSTGPGEEDQKPNQLSFGRRTILQSIGVTAAGIGTTTQSVGARPADNPTVYVGARDNTLYAVNAATGELKWAFSEPSDWVNSPTVVGGRVYVGASQLYAVDAETGDRQWAFDAATFSPTVVNGTVYAGSGNLYAVDAATGELEWEFEQTGLITSAPTVVDGTVFVGSEDYNLYAVDAETGEQEWMFTEASDYINNSPTLAGGSVYVGADDGNLYAVDAETGEQDWVFEISDSAGTATTVADGTVYVGTLNETLHAVDALTGEQKWEFTGFPDSVTSSPTVVDGTVYVGGDNDYASDTAPLFAIDTATGDEEWTFEADGGIRSSPTVLDGTVYVGSEGGKLYAVDSTTGDLEWEFTEPNSLVVSSPTVVSDPTDGNSVGSRVLLRTLGHHNQETASNYGLSGIEFDPSIHSFGFRNWWGDSGETVNGEEFTLDRSSLDRDTVATAIKNNWARPTASMVDVIAAIVQSQINRETGSDGHCYGMVFAADDYYRNPESLPHPATSASDVVAPTGEFAAVGDKISNYQTSQWLTTEAIWGTMFALQNGNVNTETTMEAIKSEIDATGTAGIALYDSSDDVAHQILAFNYDDLGSTLGLHVYEPGFPGDYYEVANREELPYRMTLDKRTGEIVEQWRNYDRYAHVDPDLSLELAEAMTGDRDLFSGFVNSLVAGLYSPARLRVDAPDDATVVKPKPFPGGNAEPEVGYHDLVYILGADSEEYEIKVIGENSGEYELEVQGIQGGEVTLDESVTDTTEEGVEHAYTASIPDTSNGTESGELSRIDQDGGEEGGEQTDESPDTDEQQTQELDSDEQTTQQSREKSTLTTETRSENDESDSGLPSWVPIAGGAGGLGIAGLGAYWYKQNNTDSEDQSERR